MAKSYMIIGLRIHQDMSVLSKEISLLLEEEIMDATRSL